MAKQNREQRSGQQGSAIGKTPNPEYDLISVLYHALQAADTCQKYLRDVDGSDGDIEEFLSETIAQNTMIADRAKRLLLQRLGSGAERSSQQPQSEGAEAGTEGPI